MKVKLIYSLREISAIQWNIVVGNEYPFIRHQFLLALEESGCVCVETGWIGQHVLVYEAEKLIAVMPMYLKTHSRGEYVFDHQWTHAYLQHGVAYFPKWVTAIPFTPCQNQRIFMRSQSNQAAIVELILYTIRNLAQSNQVSSWHCLFPDQQQIKLFDGFHLLFRNDVQFQWQNRNYCDFDDFLSFLNSKYRKKIKRERRRVVESGISFESYSGLEINDSQLEIFFKFYLLTYAKKGMSAYLNLDFFKRIIATMPECLLFIFAKNQSGYVGVALSFVSSSTLYGRYWGCYEEYHSLHFETCYYQGIDYCIKHQLQKFDSGAQGEHKLARGFEPIITHSVHWFKNPDFSHAIKLYLEKESLAVKRYQQDALNYLPFKKT